MASQGRAGLHIFWAGPQSLRGYEPDCAKYPQDSDERAIAIIAGPAPNRWNAISRQMVEAGATPRSLAAGNIVPPKAPEAMEKTPEALAAVASIRRAHPLYSSITLMLLTEIINSRLFTTVRDALGELSGARAAPPPSLFCIQPLFERRLPSLAVEQDLMLGIGLFGP